jgi:hypothetical protein
MMNCKGFERRCFGLIGAIALHSLGIIESNTYNLGGKKPLSGEVRSGDFRIEFSYLKYSDLTIISICHSSVNTPAHIGKICEY